MLELFESSVSNGLPAEKVESRELTVKANWRISASVTVARFVGAP